MSNGVQPPVQADLYQQTLPVQCHDRWFAHAQELDPRLGTLTYLPTEIREMILSHTLSSHPMSNVDGLWEYDHKLGSPFNISAYLFNGYGRAVINPRIGELRQTSSSIKAEFEDVLLSKRTFRFNDPKNLDGFTTQLHKPQLDRVFSIEIGIVLLDQLDQWLKPVSQLPINLIEVRFGIYTAFNQYCEPSAVSILRDVIYAAARRVPNAKISVRGIGQEPLNQMCQNVVDEFVQWQSRRS